jgi:hypothetical protein
MPYGSSFQPTTVGSGGGGGGTTGYYGGDGGGAVRIMVYDTFTVDGIIAADGGNGTPSDANTNKAGGGAGGSVWVITDTLAGTGSFSAYGGAGGNETDGTRDGGGGAGGRIAVYYNTTSWSTGDFIRSVVTEATNFEGPNKPSESGTLAFIDVDSDIIFITDGFRWQQTDYDTDSSWFSWTDLTAYEATGIVGNMSALKINVSGTVNITHSVWNNSVNNCTIDPTQLTLDNTTMSHSKNNGTTHISLNGTIVDIQTNSRIFGNLNITAANLTVDSSSAINASYYGYLGAPFQQGGGGPCGGLYSGGYGGGGGHGGEGGTGNAVGSIGGETCGSSFQPTTTGSGGAGGGTNGEYGGNGGGAVSITVTDAFILDGIVAADGGNGTSSTSNNRPGGGAGGSIWVRAHNLTGVGNFSAAGGPGGDDTDSATDGGGGGGGRVAVYYNVTSWTTTEFKVTNVSGGTGHDDGPGSVGTLAFINDSSDDVFIFHGFQFQDNDATGGNISYNTFNATDANVTFNESVTANATTGFNMVNVTLDDDGGSHTSYINSPVITFDSDCTLNFTGRLDMTYTTALTDTGATYIDGLALTVELNNVSEIAWINSSLAGVSNVSTHVKLGTNSAHANSSAIAGLNTTANITLYGITFIEPKEIWDPEDDGSFTDCPADVCQNLSYANSVFRYNVTHFTNFSSDETNLAPSTTQMILNSTSGTNYTDEDLDCWAKGEDPEDLTLYPFWQWWNGTTLEFSGNSTVSNGTLSFITKLTSGNTTKGENWTCSVLMYDGTANETAWNNLSMVILNKPPTVPVPSYPLNDSNTTDRTPFFNWTASTDADTDPVTYHLIVDNDTDFATPVFNVTGIGTNDYTSTIEFGVDDRYYWKVRAGDGTENSSWSTRYEFDVFSALILNLTVDTVNFGTLNRSLSNNTEDNSPPPFILENLGNINVSVNITATQLWVTVAYPSHYYQYKVAENETGSFNTAASQTTWYNMTNSENKYDIDALDWDNSSDSAKIHINVTAPYDEPGGVSKSSNVTFHAYDV